MVKAKMVKKAKVNPDISYPSTKPFSELTEQEKTERVSLSYDLLELLQYWRGDTRLTSWEENFLTSMVQLIQENKGTAKITPKQIEKIQEIIDYVSKIPEISEDIDQRKNIIIQLTIFKSMISSVSERKRILACQVLTFWFARLRSQL